MSYMKNYEDLANAIVLQAVRDYRQDPISRDRIEHFFRSQWFTQLTDLNGDYLIRKLREEVVE